MGLMTRDQILAAQDIAFADLDLSDIPGWGVVRVKDLTAAERDRLEASMVSERSERQPNGQVRKVTSANLENVRARFCAACIVGEDLRPLFTEADVKLLGAKSARALDRIFDHVKANNGLDDKAVGELVENFSEDQSGGLPSA